MQRHLSDRNLPAGSKGARQRLSTRRYCPIQDTRGIEALVPRLFLGFRHALQDPRRTSISALVSGGRALTCTLFLGEREITRSIDGGCLVPVLPQRNAADGGQATAL